jgi:hypothetical protein
MKLKQASITWHFLINKCYFYIYKYNKYGTIALSLYFLLQICILFTFSIGSTIDIESLQNRLLKDCYVPATSAVLPRVSFFFSFLLCYYGHLQNYRSKQGRQYGPFSSLYIIRCLWALRTNTLAYS